MPTDEHPPPPAHRPVQGSVLLTGLAAARAGDGATADQPPRLAGPRHGRLRASTRRTKTAGPQAIYPARRSAGPSLPPRALAAYHPPRFICQKRPPGLHHGG